MLGIELSVRIEGAWVIVAVLASVIRGSWAGLLAGPHWAPEH